MLYRNRLSKLDFCEVFVNRDDRVLLSWGELTYDDVREFLEGIITSSTGDSEARLMEVNGPQAVSGSAMVRPVSAAPPAGTELEQPALEIPRDEVSISSAARMLEQIVNDPELRAARIEQIRAAIESGDYETPEKLQIALDRLLQSIGYIEP